MRNYNPLLGRFAGVDGMKTGFICASGFNLVATAIRGNKRLIAVVLGAPSGAARAMKAAEMLEGGFNQNPLAWLTPSLGTVDALAPMDVAPPNLKDQTCGGHRKRPAAEDEDADADSAAVCRRCRAATFVPAVGIASADQPGSAVRSRTGDADRCLYRTDTDAGPIGSVASRTGSSRARQEENEIQGSRIARRHQVSRAETSRR